MYMTTNKGVILVDGGDPYHKADPGMLKAVYHYLQNRCYGLDPLRIWTERFIHGMEKNWQTSSFISETVRDRPGSHDLTNRKS